VRQNGKVARGCQICKSTKGAGQGDEGKEEERDRGLGAGVGGMLIGEMRAREGREKTGWRDGGK
jgi:hypothetical protein